MNPNSWLIAEDLHGRAEYLVHRASPRFIARIVDEDLDDYDPDGITLSLDDSQTLVEIDWIDPPPHDLLQLIREARMALAIYEERLEADVENADE